MMIMMKMWAVAKEKYHAGEQMGRHKGRKAQTQRDILMLAVSVGNLRR